MAVLLSLFQYIWITFHFRPCFVCVLKYFKRYVLTRKRFYIIDDIFSRIKYILIVLWRCRICGIFVSICGTVPPFLLLSKLSQLSLHLVQNFDILLWFSFWRKLGWVSALGRGAFAVPAGLRSPFFFLLFFFTFFFYAYRYCTTVIDW